MDTGGGRDVFVVTHGRSHAYDDRPSRPYNLGTEHVGFSLTRQTLPAPSFAKCREVFRESDTGEETGVQYSQVVASLL